MKKVQKHISLLLLAVLSVFIVPKELIHELHGAHHDTVDHRCYDTKAQVGEEHHHCIVLQLSAPEYASHIRTTDVKAPAVFIKQLILFHESGASGIFYSHFLRGPPPIA